MFVGQPNSNRQLQILVSINGIYTQNYLNGKNMIDRVFFWGGFPFIFQTHPDFFLPQASPWIKLWLFGATASRLSASLAATKLVET